MPSSDWISDVCSSDLNDTGTHAPLAGFTNNGYKLVYTDEPSAYLKAIQKNYHRVDATHSLGLGTDDKGAVSTVTWNSPAFKAGLDVGDAITATNGAPFRSDERRVGKEGARKL